jgi:hypothetical protein
VLNDPGQACVIYRHDVFLAAELADEANVVVHILLVVVHAGVKIGLDLEQLTEVLVELIQEAVFYTYPSCPSSRSSTVARSPAAASSIRAPGGADISRT